MKKFLDLFRGQKNKTHANPVQKVAAPAEKQNVLPFKGKGPQKDLAQLNREDKAVIELMQKKIVEKMKNDPQMQKKAAHIISDMLNKKVSGKD